jgi:3-phenylpropionate/cinnamic acid dioxygenase small subunit
MSDDDRAELTELMHRFAAGIDERDWVKYRSVFTDEIDLDYSSWRPDSVGRWRADDWVARGLQIFPGLTFSRHTLTNHVISVDDDDAVVSVNVCAEHVIVDGNRTDVFTLNGYYNDRCVRTDDGWRIAVKQLIVQWCSGDVDVMSRARARAALLLDGSE